jgi:hypothetical protein
VPEGERPQKRSQRRRRHHSVAQDQTRAPGSQHVHVIDAVRPGEHPVHQRHHLPARQRRPRQPGIKPHRLIRQFLDPQPIRQRGRHQQARVADQPLLIEPNLHRVEARRAFGNVRAVMHHSGDLLTGPQPPDTTAIKALLRRTFKSQARTEPSALLGGSRLSPSAVAFPAITFADHAFEGAGGASTSLTRLRFFMRRLHTK